ncbi:ABC-F family ATP-binding cassette domain-containing protein [Clostridium beijerinckii]|jgi:ATPase components of ABC transporters with duplicated ATPase domains|uniref:ABC-F family ATP-binding cassette domain-containing protein n=2 Tax=Clostridium beijerinckii TaxID=1520 RepID=A0AAE2RV11_CLOBE|nr:ATP-binding cassette domain-containing protein [Clostridium beijerinckii]ABR34923.1 ABC transporter related [Clostridium beijerinckii NCIMB 8052]AIU01638.1 ABC transporter related protein [Clostridium beijerinckii ATCC 35702]MBF7810442.1 ABC-F family ATP-binding cassette domain-containing protein [Clostridium beijerinckii]NRT23710.1 ATP-binding cassette subfamily F protein 3 [Clostridium beijerinckii]NRT68709.1 ATP-binding cassette subfamily F protein 3 [Clostridium beijerinckii]
MIKIDNLSYSFPNKDLYHNISFTLENDQHCAFIGSSGSGKSTLIDIIMDPENYMFDGTLEIDPNCRIGYVSQFCEVDNTKETTVFEYLCEDYIKLQNEITSICSLMETSSDIDALLEKYQEALDALDVIGGDDFESTLSKKLNLANLSKLKDSKISDLSGGEFKLIQVIREMLNSPDLMIMDEPDVFLDFENLNSLKNLINSHKGMMLVITHNRYLLNNCFNKIIHLENHELQEFDGSYIDYNFTLLQTKIELQELSVADDEEIERNERIIKRLRDRAEVTGETAAGRYLKGKMKFLERLEARRIKRPFVEIKQPYIRLTTNNQVEEKVALKVNNYSAGFDEILLENVNFEIKSNDKVAIVGLNGTGKTTLLRDIFKNDNPAIEIDSEIEVAYLSQLQGEILNESNTILEEFLDAGFKTYDDVETYISNYDFEEERINQKIKDLSGGEKNILQLAKISASKANMLLLDEPTSHLDIYSQMALEEAIEKYNGAILMISHDYYSIINCVDYVLLIEDKTIRKMNMRKFRKMIYAKYFDKDYLEIEQKKRDLEIKIAISLRNTDFERAKALSEELESLIKLL